MELTEDDVLEILKLFEQSKFDFLQLEHGERKITVSKGGYVPTANRWHARDGLIQQRHGSRCRRAGGCRPLPRRRGASRTEQHRRRPRRR